MDEQPLVSVAICVYNGGLYLSEQLDSIVNQSYKMIEIIAVDDRSTDESKSILSRYANQYPNIQIHFNNANLGYTKNFEKAIMMCNGKYIALCDQDDIWLPDKIASQVATIGDSILIYHDSEFMNEQGKNLNKKVSNLFNMYEGNSPLPFVFMNCVSGHTVMFNRSLVQYALPFNPNFFHDWWLAFVAANVGSIKYLPTTLVRYRQHTTNTIDILETKLDKAQKRPNELLLRKNWVTYCSTFNGNYAKYLSQIARLIDPEMSLFSKIKLYYLLNKNKTLFQYISKSPLKKQSKDLRKLVFNIDR